MTTAPTTTRCPNHVRLSALSTRAPGGGSPSSTTTRCPNHVRPSALSARTPGGGSPLFASARRTQS